MSSSTRKIIMDSLMKLLDERPMNRISIKDIVEECGINRNTFYYHFADMPDLVEAIVKDEADLIMREYRGIASLEECIDTAMKVCVDHKRALLHIYNSVNRDIYERYLLEISEYVATAFVNNAARDIALSEDDRAVLVMGYKCECFGCVINWLNSDMNEPLRQQILRLCELRQNMMGELLRRATEDHGDSRAW